MEKKQEFLDTLRHNLDILEVAVQERKPATWPQDVVEDGYGGKILLTFFHHDETYVYASVTVNQESGQEWRRMTAQRLEQHKRLFVQVYADPDSDQLLFVPYDVADNAENAPTLATLPPPIASS